MKAFEGQHPSVLGANTLLNLGGGELPKITKESFLGDINACCLFRSPPHCSEVVVVIIVIDISRLDDDTMV